MAITGDRLRFLVASAIAFFKRVNTTPRTFVAVFVWDDLEEGQPYCCHNFPTWDDLDEALTDLEGEDVMTVNEEGATLQ